MWIELLLFNVQRNINRNHFYLYCWYGNILLAFFSSHFISLWIGKVGREKKKTPKFTFIPNYTIFEALHWTFVPINNNHYNRIVIIAMHARKQIVNGFCFTVFRKLIGSDCFFCCCCFFLLKCTHLKVRLLCPKVTWNLETLKWSDFQTKFDSEHLISIMIFHNNNK